MAKKKKEIPGPSLFADKPKDEVFKEIIAAREEKPAEIVKELPNVPPPVPDIIEPHVCVRLREGQMLFVGDECTIDDGILTGLLKEAHEGRTFIIEMMTPWTACESGMLVIARQKDKPELKTTGIGGKGIDANWFKKIIEQ